jgi:hypothetical protein
MGGAPVRPRMLVLALAGVLALPAALPQNPPVTRAAFANLERKLDRSILRLDVNDPYELLGTVRGIYLRGYGAVFTTELSLVVTYISPFVPDLTPADIQKLRQKKLAKLVSLKQSMRQMLVDTAAELDSVPASEQIVLGVTLFYRSFEIKDGLPGQIVMQASRQALLDYKAGRIKSPALDAAIRVQEL